MSDFSEKAGTKEGEQLDADGFRTALGIFPTGVTIVTTRDGNGDAIGLTVSSFNSVSMDPPLILWSIMRASPNLALFEAAEHFAVNVLADDQAEISNRFASPVADRFAGLDVTDGVGGVPLIGGSAAQFECATWSHVDGGDHLIVVGRVLRFHASDRNPLIFAKGRYETLGPERDLAVSDDVWTVKKG